jgi:hypothetical protein
MAPLSRSQGRYGSSVDANRLAAVELTDSNGAHQRLGAYWADRPVIVVYLRHFG